ncbi:hypothetical protein [Echinicola shivajiensis]|uniref:hypothetical protein n=1 Tax=Echinicola shivajiensis TaxID=1035916 RepID=UPI001BFCD5B8|nr:hypothetical protein [Echinicola shivajiensis]
MVKVALMVAAGFFSAETLETEDKKHRDLKGPKAKNYKPWKEKARKGTIVVNFDRDPITGPAYKNQRPGELNTNLVEISQDLKPIDRPTGPKGKNYKPWKNQ